MKKLNLSIAFLLITTNIFCESILLNPYNRKWVTSLNGDWNVIIDPYSRGEVAGFYKNKKDCSEVQFAAIMLIFDILSA